MLESAHAPPHVLRRACHLLLLACQVNHQGLYHRVGLPPSHFSCPDTSHLLSASHSSPPYVRIHTLSNIHQHLSWLQHYILMICCYMSLLSHVGPWENL